MSSAEPTSARNLWSREIAQVGPQGFGRSFPLSVTEVRSSSGEPHGYAITGGTFNGPTEAPIFIVTTDLNGNPIDYNTYGGPLATGTAPIQFGYGAQIIQTPQGELAVCGSVALADRVGQAVLCGHNQHIALRDISSVWPSASPGNPRGDIHG